MPAGKLFKPAVETAIHMALQQAIIEYYRCHKLLLKNQSRLSAQNARKALEKVKKLAHTRKIELLDYYSSFRNKKS
jgi:hypothetical protein